MTVRSAKAPQSILSFEQLKAQSQQASYENAPGHTLSFTKKIQKALLLSLVYTAPGVAEKLAWQYFVSPRKTRRYKLNQLPGGATSLSLQHGKTRLQGYSWGLSEKRVYLVHGWESNLSRLSHFVAPLVKNGYQVIAFDLPAHGQSKQQSTHFKDGMSALETVMRHFGKATGIIAHSAGAAMTVNMLSQNTDLMPKKLSLISPMQSAKTHLEVFSYVAGLPERLEKKLEKKLETKIGASLASTNLVDLVKSFKCSGFICHDRNDTYISHTSGEQIANAWEGAKLYSSTHLGHRRILRNQVVIDRVVHHICS